MLEYIGVVCLAIGISLVLLVAICYIKGDFEVDNSD